jgi:hypothetical protein
MTHPGPTSHEGRFWGKWVLRGHKRSHAFPKLTTSITPNDDEASDDPNDDDDAWDDLTAYAGDPDAPTAIWCPTASSLEIVSGFVSLACIPLSLPSPLRSLCRLRC